LIDDGAAFHFNGVEVHRYNLPDGRLTSRNRAHRKIVDLEWSEPIEVPPNLLVAGENILAVQVHQNFTTSPDLYFAMQMEVTTSPFPDGLRLSEAMAHNLTAVDYGGAFPDWIELYNPTPQAWDLTDYALSDDPTKPDLYRFPAGAKVPPMGYWVVIAGTDVIGPNGPAAGFGLDRKGDTLVLSRLAEGEWEPVDILTFGPQLIDTSLARNPDEFSLWQPARPSPGEPNQPLALGSRSQIRINEWLANTSGKDWFELYNPGQAIVDLGRMWVSDNPDNPEKFQIPPHSFVGPEGFLLFYANGGGTPGDYANFKLSASGEVIALFQPDLAPVDFVHFGPQNPESSEGRLPDGGIDRFSFSGGGTPETTNATDQDLDGVPDIWEMAHDLNPVLAADAIDDSDGDGMDNGSEYLSGTDPNDSASRLHLVSDVLPMNQGRLLQLEFMAVAGRTYRLEYRDDLSSATWTPLLESRPQNATVPFRWQQLIDLDAKPIQFFRVVLAE